MRGSLSDPRSLCVITFMDLESRSAAGLAVRQALSAYQER